jgi:hypothetical protein
MTEAFINGTWAKKKDDAFERHPQKKQKVVAKG